MMEFRKHKIGQYTFCPRWKEELVCKTDQGSFVIDMPMGEVCVYAPTEVAWDRQIPHWNRNDYGNFIEELEQWCQAQQIPILKGDDAGIFAV